MRRLLFAIVPLLASTQGNAQIIRSRFQVHEPSVWMSAGMAYQQAFVVVDGVTGARWEFGNSTPYTASLEKSLASGATLGLRGTTATVPLHYTSPTVVTDADANVSQVFATLHVASGSAFHSVLELSLGTTIYSNFVDRATTAKLPPLNSDPDLSFAFGYGFGYSFSPSFGIDVVEDLTTTIHQRTGLSPGDDSSVRVHGTRIVGRLGF